MIFSFSTTGLPATPGTAPSTGRRAARLTGPAFGKIPAIRLVNCWSDMFGQAPGLKKRGCTACGVTLYDTTRLAWLKFAAFHGIRAWRPLLPTTR